jgi:methylmalonyl-CoA mutase
VAADFPPVTYADWRAAVDALVPNFERLRTVVEDGVVLEPLAVEGPSLANRGRPGAFPFVRGGTPAGHGSGGWDVRQRVLVSPSAPRAAAAAAVEDLEQGGTSVWLDLGAAPLDAALLDDALTGVHLELAPISLSHHASADALRAALDGLWDRRAVRPTAGSLGLDPALAAATAGSTDALVDSLAAAVDVAAWAAETAPGVRTFVVDTTRYREAGAGDVDELALATATGVAYLRAMVTAGLPADAAFRQLEFRLSATADQFGTIAALRAARLLWARVAEALDVLDPTAARQVQHVVTTRRMLTRYDAWVNVVRGTVATFAAAVAGADAITVEPHDLLLRGAGTAGELGRRVARNTQAVLMLESRLGWVRDPAGGSFAVEQRTEDVATAAWQRFQAIEAAGGIEAALRTGQVQERLAARWDERRAAVARRRLPVTGVSEFPDRDEVLPPPPPEPSDALPRHRDAEEFEQLRARADRAAADGARPAVFLAALGPLPEHAARLGFATNLFAAGGLAPVMAGTVTAADVAEAVRASAAGLVCLCGSDERYGTDAAAVVAALAAAAPVRVYLAGRPPGIADALLDGGVDEIVELGGDAVALLGRALDALEVPA